MDTIILIFCLVLVCTGVLGTILPMVPGLILILAGIILYGWYFGFELLGMNFIIAIVILTIVGTFIDFLASVIGAKKYGASNIGIIALTIGLILGFITIGPIGIIIGPVLAIILTELFKGKTFNDALKITLGIFIGALTGITVRFFIGLLMAALFIIKVVLIYFSV